jgi:hypothetical protein
VALPESIPAGQGGANDGVSRYILGEEIISDYANNRVVKSIRFRCYKGNGTWTQDFGFNAADAHVYIYYEVVSGQIVQGTPDRLGFFISQQNNLQVNATGNPTDKIGTPLASAVSSGQKLSLFWNNSVKWIKLGATHETSEQVLTFRTSRLGSYQIKIAAQLGDLSLVQVYPRIITPNGDGANDVVVFQFGEADLSARSLTGEIFDITGIKVGTLRPGNDPGTMTWDGKTDSGSVVPSGIYIYQIDAGGEKANGTVVVAR